MSETQLAVIVLAAGQGTRMKSSTPKLLHEIAGAPMISHVCATVRALTADYVVVVVRHERERLIEVVSDELPEAIIVDQDEIPGTGRAVEQALTALPADFVGEVLVLNGDVPLLDVETLKTVIVEHRADSSSATILTTVVKDATGYGRVIRTDDGAVQKIVEQKDATDDEREVSEINAGVYLFDAPPLREYIADLTCNNAQQEKYLTDIIAALRGAGRRVSALPVFPAWRVEGINDRAQLSDAALRFNAMIIRQWQKAGVTIQDPASTWIDVSVHLSPDSTILPGTQLKGATVVASGSIIGPDTTLIDTQVGHDAVVKRTDATQAVIGAGASVGPFAYLRPGTLLDAQGKIGTFVETKNVHIGEGSKVPHLSYIGDTEIGVGSNIGAGTIVANYDGVNKHHTTVGSYVKTGAHNVFVAPVTIDDGVYSGAGTVIRNNVPSGALAMTVAPQRNVEEWVHKHRPDTDADRAASASRNTTDAEDQK